MSDKLRITGLATGLDIDTMVKTMMKAENMKMDKLIQNKQILQWKQDLYRDVIGNINMLKSTYFDVLKSDSYILSPNAYSAFDVTSNSPTVATVTANAGSVGGTYTLKNITLAEAASVTGIKMRVKEAQNSIASSGVTIDSTNNNITTMINGVSYNISLTSGTYANAADISSMLNNALTSATKIGDSVNSYDLSASLSAQISMDSTRLQFVNKSISNPSEQINLMGTAMSSLGFTSTITDIYPSGNDRISSLINSTNSSNGYVEFTINNVLFKYDFATTDKDKTINDILNDISSKAGVKASYSELGQVFTLSSNTTGSNQQISASETGVNNGFLSTLFGPDPIFDQGSNAVVTITDANGNTTTVNKPTNSFTIDGVNYNLLNNDSSTNGVTLTLTSNTQKVFDRIKGFIDKYNETIDKIQEKATEKKQYTYKPLTDDQKKEMSQDDIKKWEEKAKEGLLSGDSMLQNILNSMRRAFSDGVSGAGITLKEIGLSTSSDYNQGGKIIIDETKLKEAIKNKGDLVSNIFAKSSQINYDPDHKSDSGRYSEIGIFQRINDVVKDYLRTSRDSSGKKGLLIEKAGIVGDLSQFQNTISKQINENYDKRIKRMAETLAEKENRYYQQFSKLETAMQKMNEQSSWLSQQLGSMGGQ